MEEKNSLVYKDNKNKIWRENGKFLGKKWEYAGPLPHGRGPAYSHLNTRVVSHAGEICSLVLPYPCIVWQYLLVFDFL